MNKTLLNYLCRATATLLILIGGALDVGADETDDAVARQWAIVSISDNAPVKPNTVYGIKNLVVQRSFIYGERDRGINLNWAKENQSNIIIKRKSASTEPIKFGELVAIQVKDSPQKWYLKYKVRTRTVNLGWSTTPVYEWKFIGGKDDEVVTTSRGLGIYSIVEKDNLVYCKRNWGINLKWEKDMLSDGCKTYWDSVKAVVTEAGTNAIPYGGGAFIKEAIQ